MKTVICIVLFFLLALYICRYSKYIGEDFTEHNKSKDSVVLETLNGTNIASHTSIYIEGSSDQVPGFDQNNIDPYSTKPWDIKNVGFSDIFNYTDSGGLEVYQRATMLENNNKNFAQDFILGKRINDEVEQETIDITKFPDTYEYNNEYYERLGRAFNNYYNQHYIIYEFKVLPNVKITTLKEQTKYLESQLYKYLLVQMDGNNIKVIYATGPRGKININDVVHLSFGIYKVGPLKIEE